MNITASIMLIDVKAIVTVPEGERDQESANCDTMNTLQKVQKEYPSLVGWQLYKTADWNA